MTAEMKPVEVEVVDATVIPAATEEATRESLLPALAATLDPAVIDMERALGMLSSVERALANPDLAPSQLNDMRAHLDALIGLLQRVSRSTVLANVGVAYRIQTEQRIGQYLNTLEQHKGQRKGPRSEFQQAVRDELGISYKTAQRWRDIGAESAEEVVGSYIAPAFAALKRSTTGESPLDENGDPETLLSTAQLLRMLHTADGGGGSGSSTPTDGNRVDDTAGVLSLELPQDLLDVLELVLGEIDRHAGELGMRDPDWRGRVLVIPPPASAVPFSVHLLQLYEQRAVSDALLVVQTAQNSPWWRPFAGWPHCLLSSAAMDGLPNAPLTVFALSEDAELRVRFNDAFTRLGYLYPNGAVSDIAEIEAGEPSDE